MHCVAGFGWRRAGRLKLAPRSIDKGHDESVYASMKRAKKHHPLQPPKVRNPVARSPLLGKGGAHGKTTAAKRRAARIALVKELRDPEPDA